MLMMEGAPRNPKHTGWEPLQVGKAYRTLGSLCLQAANTVRSDEACRTKTHTHTHTHTKEYVEPSQFLSDNVRRGVAPPKSLSTSALLA